MGIHEDYNKELKVINKNKLRLTLFYFAQILMQAFAPSFHVLQPISAQKHKQLNHSKLDYGLMGDLSKLCNMVVSYVDKTKHIVRSKQTNDIYELARDIIQNMERVIQVKFGTDSYSIDEDELHSINNYKKLLRINGAKLCNQYQRFNAWVNVYRYLK